MSKQSQTTQAVQESQSIQPAPIDPTFLTTLSSPDFIDPNARLPRIQVVRGEYDPQQFGFFIPLAEMAKAGWGDFDIEQIVEYKFQSGQTEQGLLLKAPRMLVCPKSIVFGIDRQKSQDEQTTVIVGEYSKHKDSANVQNAQIYQIFLVNDKNEPLHQVPLMYKAKGANQATFSIEWQKFCGEFNACFSIINPQASSKPKNNAFNSLLVFCPQLSRDLVGDKVKGFAVRVVGYEKPTLENWTNFLFGATPEKANFVWQQLTPNDPLTLPGTTSAALPPAATSPALQAAIAAVAQENEKDPMPF